MCFEPYRSVVRLRTHESDRPEDISEFPPGYRDTETEHSLRKKSPDK
jgi:hypothetical protein